MSNYSLATWTESEDAVIRRIYPKQGSTGCMKLLGDRSRQSVTKRANRLGVTYARHVKVVLTGEVWPRDLQEAQLDSGFKEWRYPVVGDVQLKWVA